MDRPDRPRARDGFPVSQRAGVRQAWVVFSRMFWRTTTVLLPEEDGGSSYLQILPICQRGGFEMIFRYRSTAEK